LILLPIEVYSAAQFVEDVCPLIDDMHARGKTPILVGGTMLYFKALLEGFLITYQCRSNIRDEIEAKAEMKAGKLFMMNWFS
jgi:tRNA dimethylallyltransferase